MHAGCSALALACAAAAGCVDTARAGSTMLFSQPDYTDGVANHFSVTSQPRPWNPIGQFYVHANQPNPYNVTRTYQPVTWSASQMTGLECPFPLSIYQAGIRVPVSTGGTTGIGHSVAQICQDASGAGAIGAFMNGADLIRGSADNRMMITGEYHWAQPRAVYSAPGTTLSVSLDFQAPNASSSGVNGYSNAYTEMDLLFVGPGGARAAVTVALFKSSTPPIKDGSGFDDLNNTAIAAPVLPSPGHFVTMQPGTSPSQGAVWRGWKHFAFRMSYNQFKMALALAEPQAKEHGFKLSPHPEDYRLTSTHINAEGHTVIAQPATLGWSMRKLQILLLD